MEDSIVKCEKNHPAMTTALISESASPTMLSSPIIIPQPNNNGPSSNLESCQYQCTGTSTSIAPTCTGSTNCSFCDTVDDYEETEEDEDDDDDTSYSSCEMAITTRTNRHRRHVSSSTLNTSTYSISSAMSVPNTRRDLIFCNLWERIRGCCLLSPSSSSSQEEEMSSLQYAIQVASRRRLLYSFRFWTMIFLPLVVLIGTMIYYTIGTIVSENGISNADSNGYYSLLLDNRNNLRTDSNHNIDRKILQQGSWRSNRLEGGGGGSIRFGSTSSMKQASTWMFGYSSKPLLGESSTSTGSLTTHHRTRNRHGFLKDLFGDTTTSTGRKNNPVQQQHQKQHNLRYFPMNTETTAGTRNSKPAASTTISTTGTSSSSSSPQDIIKHHTHARQHRVIVDFLSTRQGSSKTVNSINNGSNNLAVPLSNPPQQEQQQERDSASTSSSDPQQQQQQGGDFPLQQQQLQHPNPAIYGWTPSMYPNPKSDPVSCGISYILEAHQREEERLQRQRLNLQQQVVSVTSSSDYSNMGVVMDAQLGRSNNDNSSNNGSITVGDLDEQQQQQQLRQDPIVAPTLLLQSTEMTYAPDEMILMEDNDNMNLTELLQRTEMTYAPTADSGGDEIVLKNDDTNVTTPTSSNVEIVDLSSPVTPLPPVDAPPQQEEIIDDSNFAVDDNSNLRLCDPDWMLGGLLLEQVSASMYNFSETFSPNNMETSNDLYVNGNKQWDVAVGGSSTSNGGTTSTSIDPNNSNRRNMIERYFDYLYTTVTNKYSAWISHGGGDAITNVDGIFQPTQRDDTNDNGNNRFNTNNSINTIRSVIIPNNNINKRNGGNDDNVVVYPQVELAVATVRKMNLLSVLRQGSYYAYEDQDDMVSDAAQIFARTLHDTWWNSNTDVKDDNNSNNNNHYHQPGDYGILLFLSIQDRICFISTGSAVQHVLPWWRLDHIVASMKPDLRHEQYGTSIITAIHDLTSMLIAGPPNLQDRIHDFITRFGIVIAFAIFTFLFGIYGEYRDRYKRYQYAEQRSILNPIDYEKAIQLQTEYKTLSCPICLENFNQQQQASSTGSVVGSTTSTNNNSNHNNINTKKSFFLRTISGCSTCTSNSVVEKDQQQQQQAQRVVGNEETMESSSTTSPPTETSSLLLKKSTSLSSVRTNTNTNAISVLRGADNKRIKLLRCGHIFCDTCWKQWVHSGCGNPCKCPVCRQDIGKSNSNTKMKKNSNTINNTSGSVTTATNATTTNNATTAGTTTTNNNYNYYHSTSTSSNSNIEHSRQRRRAGGGAGSSSSRRSQQRNSNPTSSSSYPFDNTTSTACTVAEGEQQQDEGQEVVYLLDVGHFSSDDDEDYVHPNYRINNSSCSTHAIQRHQQQQQQYCYPDQQVILSSICRTACRNSNVGIDDTITTTSPQQHLVGGAPSFLLFHNNHYGSNNGTSSSSSSISTSRLNSTNNNTTNNDNNCNHSNNINMLGSTTYVTRNNEADMALNAAGLTAVATTTGTNIATINVGERTPLLTSSPTFNNNHTDDDDY